MSKDQTKTVIQDLVKKYNSYKKQGLLKKYNEDNTCKDFILPLFKALGWSVESSREVEGQKNVSGGRVDYAFYLDGIPKFFLEAKAIPEDLNKESYIKQAIDYAYNKGVTWAVLSDFEGIKVFNAEWHTTPSKACVLNLSVGDYSLEIDLLWELSKEGMEQDLLYERARKIGQVAVKEPVGERLYKDLTLWRELFFKYISGYHSDFSFAQVDEVIQRILNRFVFIRTCEDRQIEPPYLLPLVREWKTARNINLQQKIKELFKDFDSWYNSKLFDHHLCDDIDIEDTPYAEIIEGLYGSKDEIVRYDFNAIGVDVLGRVYEQYLGYVAKTVEPKRKKQLVLEGLENELIKIEKEKKRRKEQGIYYTPNFIVDYIVKNALKPVLDKCNCVEDLKKIKVLDPACGSGSFLIKTLEVINDKYKEFNYAGDELTKIQILNENIYGIDLDEQAVEIARLNLLLNSLDRRMELPLLKNIRNGNSLISGTDEELKNYFGENFRDKKPFNWQEEFPEVFNKGGFDVIIGNPPYIKEDTNKEAFDGLHKNPYYQGKMDIWTMFGCVGIDLLRNNGLLGFIAPNNWVTNYGASIFRNKILNDGEIKTFVDFGDYRIFEGASIQTMVLIYQKKKPRERYSFEYLKVKNRNIVYSDLIKVLFSKKSATHISIRPTELYDKFLSFNEPGEENILGKLRSSANYTLASKDIGNGIDVLQDFIAERHLLILNDNTIKKGDGIFVLSDNEIGRLKLTKQEKQYLKPYFTPSQINRYLALSNTDKKIIYADTYFREHINSFPNLRSHIDRFKKILTSAFAPYGLHRTREKRFFEGEGIFTIRKTKEPAFSYVNFPCYVTRAFMIIKPKNINLKYLTGIFNSSVVFFWLRKKGKLQGEQLQIDKEPLLSIPIFIGNKKQQKQIIILVEKIIKLNLEIQKIAENSEKWISLKTEIEKTDKKIDQLVHKLYGLTPKEIEIVEKNTK